MKIRGYIIEKGYKAMDRIIWAPRLIKLLYKYKPRADRKLAELQEKDLAAGNNYQYRITPLYEFEEL